MVDTLVLFKANLSLQNTPNRTDLRPKNLTTIVMWKWSAARYFSKILVSNVLYGLVSNPIEKSKCSDHHSKMFFPTVTAHLLKLFADRFWHLFSPHGRWIAVGNAYWPISYFLVSIGSFIFSADLPRSFWLLNNKWWLIGEDQVRQTTTFGQTKQHFRS